MSRLVVVPNKKEDIPKILSYNIDEIIIGVNNLSIYPLTLSVEEIIDISNNTNKDVTIAINKMIHNDDLDLVNNVLDKVKDSNIKKILFYDLGVFNLIKKKNINKECILSEEHLNASTYSNNFYYNKGIKSSLITSDITFDEVLNIKNNSKMNIYYTAYGYLPIFYSRRKLLTSYFTYIDKNKDDDTYYIFNNSDKYMIKEKDFGTIIYSDILNLLDKIDDISVLDNLVIDLSYTDDISIINKFINKEKEEGNTFFYDKKTTYKLRGDNNE